MSSTLTTRSAPSGDARSPGELRRELPVRYYDARMFSVLYAVDLRDANDMLCTRGAHAVALPRAKALLTLSWFRYPDSTIGAYDEFAVSLLATSNQNRSTLPLLQAFSGTGDVAGFVLHLPVTSELACAGGRELFGFPKILAQITLTESSTELHGELGIGGRSALRMRIPLGRGLSIRLKQLSTYSVLRGELVRTAIPVVGGDARLMPARGVTLEQLAPELSVVRTIRHLVGRRAPLGVIAVRGYSASLGENHPVSDPG